jgi:ubiquinone/menaquinone biosynthesis C-methylase UbiE
MVHHLVHCIILNQLGESIQTPNGRTQQQALAKPIVDKTPPYSIADMGCGSGIWACDMARLVDHLNVGYLVM